MNMLKKLFLRLYPKQPETSAGQAIAFSFLLTVVFGVLSFFQLAGLFVLVVSLLSSFIHATIAHDLHFRTGFLPPVAASFALQFLYFATASDVYPWYVMATAIMLNVLPVAVLAALGAGVASRLISQNKKKDLADKEKLQKDRSRFSENIQRLAVVTLFVYGTMHIFVPFAARVSAVEKLSPDQFIKQYDPDKDYQPATEPIVPEPPGYSSETGGAKGQTSTLSEGKLPTWQQVQAKEAVAAKVAQQKQQKQTTESLKKKNLSYKELHQLAQKGKITSAQMVELVNNGVSKGKISWWDATKFYASGVGRAVQEVGNRIVKAVKPVVDWVAKNPVKTAAIVVAAIAVVAAAVFIPVVAAAAVMAVAWGAVGLSYIGTAVAIGTGLYLGYSYIIGGSEGLKKAVFSEDTFSLMAQGDFFGAIGSGAVDVFNTVDSLIPVAAVAKLPGKIAQVPGFIGKVGQAIETVKEVRQIRIVITDSTGLLNGGGLATLKRAFLNAIAESPEAAKNMKQFAFNLVDDPQWVALLNKAGDDIATAKGLGSKNIAPIVEKKATEVAQVARGKNDITVKHNSNVTAKSTKKYTPFTHESYRKMPLNWEKIVSGEGETRIEHVRLHEMNDMSKPKHGVFNGDAVEITENAWKSRGKAIIRENGNKVEYTIPYNNAGYQGGYNGTGQQLNNVKIVVLKGTTDIISAFPY